MLFNRTWKYWHAPMLHAKVLGIVVAYNMYKECCQGRLKTEWKIQKPMSFYRFCEKLAKQILNYSPKNRNYPGDEKFRVSTQQHKARWVIHQSFSMGSTMTSSSQLTKSDFDKHKNRLCGDLTPLYAHMQQCIPIQNKGHKKCVVCGEHVAWSVLVLVVTRN